jgi:hypothetical protein
MPIWEIIVELIIEIGRTVFVEELSERVRRVRMRRPKGMASVRRHIHQATRRRLLNRLSTESKLKRTFP